MSDALWLAALALLPAAGLLLATGSAPARPAGLALLGLAVPLLLLHLLRPRRARRPVGSLLLWQEAQRALEGQAPFRRLRRNLSLALLLAALVLLAVAYARPSAKDASSSGDLVLVLDLSASLRARDEAGGVTRFAAARALALELARKRPSGSSVLAIAATPRGARTVVPWSADQGAIERALDELEPSGGGADLNDAVLLALAAARPRAAARVHVLTDGDSSGPPPAQVEVHRFGTSGENVGIVAIELRPLRERGVAAVGSSERVQALATVRNAGRVERSLYAELRKDGRPLAARRLTVAPGARAAVALEARVEPGALSVALAPAPGDPAAGKALDLLREDDEAWLYLPGREATVALVSDRPSPALLRALLATGLAPVERRAATELHDPSIRFVVSDGVPLPPLEVPALLVNPPRAVGPVDVKGTLEAPAIARWDADDRLLREAEPEDVTVARARGLSLGEGARALVSSDRGPLAAAFREGDLEHVVLAFDPQDSTWPLRPSWPIFVGNVLAAALDDHALAPRGPVRAGTAVTLRARTELTVEHPSGRTTSHTPDAAGRVLFTATDAPGLYRVRAGERSAGFAVSLLDERETDCGPRAPPVAPVAPLDTRAGGEREVLFPFVLAALALLLLEGFAYHRRL